MDRPLVPISLACGDDGIGGTLAPGLGAAWSRSPDRHRPGRGRLTTLRIHWGAVLATALGLVGYGGMVALDATEGTLRADVVPRTIGLYLVAFAGFVIALVWQERRGIPWRWLVLAPVLFRGLLLLTSPTLSDDVYRYLWDGHLLTEGQNPYEYVVEDPRLDEYQIDLRELVNQPDYATPYLPVAQLVFAGAAATAPAEPLTMQLVMVGFDVVTVALIVAVLGTVGLPRERMAIYWWNPLVVVEIAHGAHLDALMVALALLAVFLSLTERGPGWAAPVALALATLTRPLPVLLVPVLWWRWSWFQRVACPVVVVTLVVPFGLTGGWELVGEPDRTGVFGSARFFFEEVTFNGGPYRWIESLLGRVDLLSDPAASARTVTTTLVAVVAALSSWRAREASPRGLLSLAVVPLAVSVLLSSIVHPWYLLVVVAFLPFLAPGDGEDTRRWWYVAPWLYLSGALVLSYLTYRDPLAFGELPWVRLVEWLPTVALLGVAAAIAGSGPVPTRR